jgi:type IV pilus modification protein PilV
MPHMKARGFTLVESMIGLVILSLGLLGAWAMLLSALRSHGDALYRTAATHLLRDMADRIRANPDAGALYDTRNERPATPACDDATPCDAAQTAAADIAWFTATASAAFPAEGLSTTIEYEPAIGPASTDRYSLFMNWRGPRDTESGNAVALQVLAQPVAG